MIQSHISSIFYLIYYSSKKRRVLKMSKKIQVLTIRGRTKLTFLRPYLTESSNTGFFLGSFWWVIQRKILYFPVLAKFLSVLENFSSVSQNFGSVSWNFAWVSQKNWLSLTKNLRVARKNGSKLAINSVILWKTGVKTRN